MSNKWTKDDEYLKSFFTNEIYFLSSPELQREAWKDARGEKFGVCLLVSFESWSNIVKHRKNFKISDYQFEQIKKLFDMLESFQADIDYPINPSQYRDLLENPHWKKIQRYALELYKRAESLFF
jgi:hypothetical protein